MAAPLADSGLSIVIPVLNEANGLDRQLTDLKSKLRDITSCEVIVCDGGSTDNTINIAESHQCTVVTGATGRSAQLNAGAKACNYSHLLFLHADTNLPVYFYQSVINAQQWGFFRVKLSGERPVFSANRIDDQLALFLQQHQHRRPGAVFHP